MSSAINSQIWNAKAANVQNADGSPIYSAGIWTFKNASGVADVGLIPVASVIPFAGAAAPTGYLLCDGSAVSRTTYAALFAVLSTTYGVGDNSTTFNVPDMRETVPVGVGTRAAGVAAHDTYTLGQFKDDQTQSHTHGYALSSGAAGAVYMSMYTINKAADTVVNVTTANDGRLGTTTRTKQIGLNYIIKA